MADLATRSGVAAYIETELIPTVRDGWTRSESLQPFGVVFARRIDKKLLPTPQRVLVGEADRSAAETRSMIRKAVKKTCAEGAVYIRHAEWGFKLHNGQMSAVVVQLEHKRFGDHVWVAHVMGHELMPFESSELTASALDVKRTTFNAARWMN